jgi:hypothetical protein
METASLESGLLSSGTARHAELRRRVVLARVQPSNSWSSLEGWSSEEAACGRRVRLVFPVPFDTAECYACPECVEMAQLWVDDRPAFDARVEEREQRRREKADRRYEAERAEVDYEEFLRRQDAALWEGKPPPADQDEDDDLAL